jgi:hypothetical protein
MPSRESQASGQSRERTRLLAKAPEPCTASSNEDSKASDRTSGNVPLSSNRSASNPAEGKVDDVLESLHRSLRDQETVQKLLAVVKKSPPTTRVVPGANLSGAAIYKRPPRRRIQKSKAPLKEPRVISSARCLVGAAESLGLDMSSARALIASSEGNLGRRRARAAATDASKALSEAKLSAEGQLQILLPELQAKIDDLKANGCRSSSAEKGLSIAKAALRKKNYRTAIAALSTARKALAEAQTAFIRKILLESKSKFVTAKKAGVNIDTSVRALVTAKESLRLGDLGNAVRLARRAESAVEVTMKAHRNASRTLAALTRALSVAEHVDANVAEERVLLQQSKALFENGSYFKSEELSERTLEAVDSRLRIKMLESIERAEKALCLAKEAGASYAGLESRLTEAKTRFAEKEYLRALAVSNSVLVDAAADALNSVNVRLGEIGQFAKSVNGEIESLAQVQEAIVHSRERNLEMVRKYGSMSEEVVSQAYDNAAAYMRVSQDIVKQAYDSSVGLDNENRVADSEPATAVRKSPPAQILGVASGDRKLRIIDLYLSGRIDDKQLDKLLSLVDSTTTQIEISDEIQDEQFAKR